MAWPSLAGMSTGRWLPIADKDPPGHRRGVADEPTPAATGPVPPSSSRHPAARRSTQEPSGDLAPVALDTSGQHPEPATSTTVHTVSGDLTVTLEIRYINGPAGDRIAATQANAIYALLEWVAHQDAATDHTHQLASTFSAPADRSSPPQIGAGSYPLSRTGNHLNYI